MQQTVAALSALALAALAALASPAAGGVLPGAARRAAAAASSTTLEAAASIGHAAHALPLEHHEEHHEEPKPYKFGYGVKDSHHGLDFDQHETSDGHVVTGQYRVQLPDGRTQVVTYTADWKNGYNANVQYEGEALHPKELKAGAAGHGWAGAAAAAASGAALEAAPEYSLGSGGSSYSTGGSDHGGKWTPSHL